MKKMIESERAEKRIIEELEEHYTENTLPECMENDNEAIKDLNSHNIISTYENNNFYIGEVLRVYNEYYDTIHTLGDLDMVSDEDSYFTNLYRDEFIEEAGRRGFKSSEIDKIIEHLDDEETIAYNLEKLDKMTIRVVNHKDDTIESLEKEINLLLDDVYENQCLGAIPLQIKPRLKKLKEMYKDKIDTEIRDACLALGNKFVEDTGRNILTCECGRAILEKKKEDNIGLVNCPHCDKIHVAGNLSDYLS